jgi:ABC-2 type transport system permease protein
MNTIGTIAWKEIKTYFASPLAYVISAFFVGLTGYFFGTAISKPFAEASSADYLLSSTLILTLWAPLITMRLFAEEQKMGTLEVLLTSPLRDWEIVIGKFLASFAILAVMVAITLYYVLLLVLLGDPDPGPILTGYLGLLLYGMATLSIGVFASSLTSNQLLAGTMAMSVLLLLNFIQGAGAVVSGWPSQVLHYISLSSRFTDFTRGILDGSSIVFYLSFTGLFLFLTVKSLESQRWR